MNQLFEDILDLCTTVITAYLAQEERDYRLSIYDSYLALNRFNETYHSFLVNYLAVSLDEDYLQDSMIGTPMQIWREVTNSKFEKTTDAARELVLSLHMIWFLLRAQKSALLSKSYDDFFCNVYDGGMIDEIGTGIDTVSFSIDNDCIAKKKIYFDISTFEKRMELVEKSKKTYSKFVELENLLLQKIEPIESIEEVDQKKIPMRAIATKEEIPKNELGFYIVDNDNIRCVIHDLILGVTVHNIDTSNVTDMSNLFEGNENFNENINHWDVSNVINMRYMFSGAIRFNQPLDKWDVARVIDMDGMFNCAHSFNQPLKSWDVSNVVLMGYMFSEAHVFNQSIGNWDVSNVTDMWGMFSGAIQFNQPLNGWNISKVKALGEIFNGARNFNQPLNKWDTSNVVDMMCAFTNALVFNQPLENWNVSKVTRMYGMFANAKLFNQPLNNWDASSVKDMDCMFCGALAFDQPLSSWNLLSCTNMNGMLYGAKSFNQSLQTWNLPANIDQNTLFEKSDECIDICGDEDYWIGG